MQRTPHRRNVQIYMKADEGNFVSTEVEGQDLTISVCIDRKLRFLSLQEFEDPSIPMMVNGDLEFRSPQQMYGRADLEMIAMWFPAEISNVAKVSKGKAKTTSKKKM